MGNLIRHYAMKYMMLLIILITILCSVFLYAVWADKRWDYNEGEIRVQANQLIYALEQDRAVDTSELPYFIFDQNGKVIESTMDEYLVGTAVNLHKIGGLKNYIVPIQLHGNQNVTLFIDCTHQKSAVAAKRKILFTVLISVFLIVFICVLLHIRKQFLNNIIKPIKQLHDSTKGIQAGNLEKHVEYDYDGEIGELCHDFEQMRDQIADSYHRELNLREKMHVMYASISHDLKTPLATITGYLENIIYDVVEGPEQIKACANRMLNKSQVLNKLIDDILEHSKAELNDLSIEKKEVYSLSYFKDIMTGYETDAKSGHYQFSYDLPDNYIIMLDPDRIGEVFQNLIGNAIKYGGNVVKIQVHFELVKEPESILLVSIKDNGPGIDAADLPFIFDVFYRGNKARTQNVPGSGLGLNISRYIIEEHGGQIECDSIVGVGTTISFSLPLI